MDLRTYSHETVRLAICSCKSLEVARTGEDVECAQIVTAMLQDVMFHASTRDAVTKHPVSDESVDPCAE